MYIRFYKTLSVFMISLSLFSSRALSGNESLDLLDPDGEVHSSHSFSITSQSSDKYEEAIRICRSRTQSSEYEVFDSYEEAMKVCGAISYRLQPWATWAMDFASLFVNNYEMLISLALHHIVGDMMHIVELGKDNSYRESRVSDLL